MNEQNKPVNEINVSLCPHGGIHFYLGNTTLHLHPREFVAFMKKAREVLMLLTPPTDSGQNVGFHS